MMGGLDRKGLVVPSRLSLALERLCLLLSPSAAPAPWFWFPVAAEPIASLLLLDAVPANE